MHANNRIHIHWLFRTILFLKRNRALCSQTTGSDLKSLVKRIVMAGSLYPKHCLGYVEKD